MNTCWSAAQESILAGLPHRPLVVLQRDIASCAGELLRRSLRADALCLVSDENTHAALGERLAHTLGQAYRITTLLLPGTPAPDEAAAAPLTEAAHGVDALIAVGSGTINDLCKYASHRAGRPYAVFPTAPSMNGYTSANASLIVDNLRQSFAAQLPAAVLCDTDVLAAAPVRLIRAGLGDSLARPTAQADWLLSHLLKATPYDPRPFELTAPPERELFESAAALARGDAEAVTRLMKVLLLSGFGMTLAGGSHPASQGEHMIAHAYEMLARKRGLKLPHNYHGEEIGVTTLTMARLQENTLRHCEERSGAAIQSGLLRCARNDIAQLQSVMLLPAYLESVLKAAGAPTTPAELGWDEALYAEAICIAPATRDRFTFLNLQS